MKSLGNVTINDEILRDFGGYTGRIVKKTERGIWATFMDSCQYDRQAESVVEWLDNAVAYGIRESVLFAFYYVCLSARFTLFVSFEEIEKGLACADFY